MNLGGTIEMQKMCISIVPIFNHLDANEMSEIVKETNSVKYPRCHTILLMDSISFTKVV